MHEALGDAERGCRESCGFYRISVNTDFKLLKKNIISLKI